MLALRLPQLSVDTGSSGEEALRRLRETPYDVLVTDLLMPGMTGLQLMQEVATLQSPPAMLLMTAHPNPAGYTLRGHGFAFVRKPIDRDFFVSTLHNAIRYRRIRRRLEEVQRRQRSATEATRYFEALLGKRNTLQAALQQIKKSLELAR